MIERNIQLSILASCCSEINLKYLEAVLKQSLSKTPLKQISGIYEDQNCQRYVQSELNMTSSPRGSKEKDNFKSIQSIQTKEELIEQLMTSKHEVEVVAFKDKSTNRHIQLDKQQSFLTCYSSFNAHLYCRYSLRGQSTFELFTTKQNNQPELIFTLNFDIISAKISFLRQLQFGKITIETGKYELTFQTNKLEAEHLHKKISRMHQNSHGNNISMHLLEETDKFYRQRYETEEYFTEHCSTGDLLLFQDDHFFAKVQRFLTGSDVDHVGMVIKDEYYGILMFQSNSKSGVCLTPWKSFISNKWYRNIPKITWRKLTKVNKDRQFKNIIQTFLMQSLQKSFHISTRVFTAQQSVIVPPEDENNNQQNSSGYFCSELIATLYKNLNLLTRDRNNQNYQPACKFYPKDFSELSGRKLDEGELSPEYQIYFDPKLLRRNYPQCFFQ